YLGCVPFVFSLPNRDLYTTWRVEDSSFCVGVLPDSHGLLFEVTLLILSLTFFTWLIHLSCGCFYSCNTVALHTSSIFTNILFNRIILQLYKLMHMHTVILNCWKLLVQV
ncbi:hypothetical protein L9F63_011204, partial [Diploptera punctata]